MRIPTPAVASPAELPGAVLDVVPRVVESFLGHGLIERLGWTLVHSLWEGVVVAALLAAALVALGLLGRPAKLRICVPVVAMLLFAALQFPLPRAADWRRFVLPAALVAMLATTLGLLWRESGVEHVRAAAVEAQVAQLPRDRLHVVWSGALPVEVVFPVWIDRRQAGRVHLTEIGAWSLAPFTRDQWRRWHRGEFREELATRSVSLIAPPQLPHWLGDYCREHLGRPMRVLESQRFDDFTRQEVTCAPR